MADLKLWILTFLSVLSLSSCYIFQDSVLIAPNDAFIITAVVHDQRIQFQAQPLPYKLKSFKSLIIDQLNNGMIVSQGNKLIAFSATTGNIDVLVDKGIGSVTTMDFDPSLKNLYWFDDVKKSVGGISLETRQKRKMPHAQNIDGPGKMRFLLSDTMENKAFYKAFRDITELQGEIPQSSQLAYNSLTNTIISSSWNGSYLIVDKALARGKVYREKGFVRNAWMDFLYCYNFEGVGSCFI